MQIPKFFIEGILPFPTSTRTGPVSVPGVPPLDPYDLPQDLIAEESSVKFKFYTRHTLQLSQATCILVNSFYDLEKSVFDAVNAGIQNSTSKVWHRICTVTLTCTTSRQSPNFRILREISTSKVNVD